MSALSSAVKALRQRSSRRAAAMRARRSPRHERGTTTKCSARASRTLVVTNREIRALKDELVAMLPLWPRVTQRVTVMQGGKDNLVPPENADFAQKMLTHATSVNIVRIPEMDHFLP